MIEIGLAGSDVEFVNACSYGSFNDTQEVATQFMKEKVESERIKESLKRSDYLMSQALSERFLSENEMILRSGKNKGDLRAMANRQEIVGVIWNRKAYYLIESIEAAALLLEEL